MAQRMKALESMQGLSLQSSHAGQGHLSSAFTHIPLPHGEVTTLVHQHEETTR